MYIIQLSWRKEKKQSCILWWLHWSRATSFLTFEFYCSILPKSVLAYFVNWPPCFQHTEQIHIKTHNIKTLNVGYSPRSSHAGLTSGHMFLRQADLLVGPLRLFLPIIPRCFILTRHRVLCTIGSGIQHDIIILVLSLGFTSKLSLFQVEDKFFHVVSIFSGIKDIPLASCRLSDFHVNTGIVR
jgi:hypothetical protein